MVTSQKVRYQFRHSFSDTVGCIHVCVVAYEGLCSAGGEASGVTLMVRSMLMLQNVYVFMFFRILQLQNNTLM